MSEVRGRKSEVGGREPEVGGRRSEVGDLDRAIDGAVREMLDVEAPANLRARVVERIDGRGVSGVQPPASSFQLPAVSFQLPAFSFQRLAAASAVAALLVLVLVFVLIRRAEPPAQAPLVARTGNQEQPALTGPSTKPTLQHAQPVDASSEAPAAPASFRGARTARTAVAAASTSVDEQTAAIEPLSAITPIAVTPIAPSSIAPDSIAVRPLNPISEMQIAPLNPPDGRN